jgi:hypothetical protein
MDDQEELAHAQQQGHEDEDEEIMVPQVERLDHGWVGIGFRGSGWQWQWQTALEERKGRATYVRSSGTATCTGSFHIHPPSCARP